MKPHAPCSHRPGFPVGDGAPAIESSWPISRRRAYRLGVLFAFPGPEFAIPAPMIGRGSALRLRCSGSARSVLCPCLCLRSEPQRAAVQVPARAVERDFGYLVEKRAGQWRLARSKVCTYVRLGEGASAGQDKTETQHVSMVGRRRLGSTLELAFFFPLGRVGHRDALAAPQMRTVGRPPQADGRTGCYSWTASVRSLHSSSSLAMATYRR